jgi:hypothetical protein
LKRRSGCDNNIIVSRPTDGTEKRKRYPKQDTEREYMQTRDIKEKTCKLSPEERDYLRPRDEVLN